MIFLALYYFKFMNVYKEKTFYFSIKHWIPHFSGKLWPVFPLRSRQWKESCWSSILWMRVYGNYQQQHHKTISDQFWFWTEKLFPCTMNVDVCTVDFCMKRMIVSWSKMCCSAYEPSSLSWTVSDICGVLKWSISC